MDIEIAFVSIYPQGSQFDRSEELTAKLRDGWTIAACVWAPRETQGVAAARMVYTLVRGRP